MALEEPKSHRTSHLPSASHIMMRAKPIQTTKWGTACAQCASAKAKCSGRSGSGGKCDRCERLLKQCTDQVQRPRKTRQPRQPNAGLADPSLDSIVSTPENPPSPSTVDLGLDFASCSSSSARSHTSAPMASLDVRPSLMRTSSMQSQHSIHHDSYFFSANPPNCLDQQQLNPLFTEGREDLDDLLLNRYRTCLMPEHPFVLIPDHVSASVLTVHRPFLMLAIRVVAGFEGLHSVQGQMQHIMDYVADHMFRQAERSIDLLMGIVVVLGWYHYHCMRHSPLNNLLCLAESLVSDLGINKRPNAPNEGRLADEKRLLLGVWYLRSSAAMYLQQLTSMPFTPYMRQCLVELDEEKDHELDEVLVYCIKLQYLTERVAVLKTPQPDLTEQQHQERGSAITSSQEYLDKLLTDMPTERRTNPILTTHINTVFLRLYEPQPSASALRVSLQNPYRSRSPSGRSSGVTGLEATLHNPNVNAQIRAWFEGWVQGIPAQAYRTLPTNLVFQLLYAVGSLLRSHSAASQPTASLSAGRPDTETIMVLDRLVALFFANFIGGQSQPDMTHFWEALGEQQERVCSPSPSCSEQGDDPLTAIPATWEQQYHYGGCLFTPPSRVGSAGPDSELNTIDLDHYQATSIPMMAGNQLHPHSQWGPQATQAAWDHHTTTPQGQMLMVPGTEGVVDPQLWGQDQGTAGGYQHPKDGYFMG